MEVNNFFNCSCLSKKKLKLLKKKKNVQLLWENWDYKKYFLWEKFKFSLEDQNADLIKRKKIEEKS